MEREYKIGPSKVFGYEPGTTVKLDIPEAQEQRLIEGGAIIPTDGQATRLTEPVSQEKDPEESVQGGYLDGNDDDGENNDEQDDYVVDPLDDERS